ncbi:MAG: NAD(P)-dependent oxidoreductase [Bacteroidota bacterium]
MTNKNFLLIDTIHPLFVQGLLKLGYNLVDGTLWTNEKVLDELPAFTGILVRSKITLDENFFHKATNLKFIARAGAGIEHIDINEAKKRNIHLITAPEGNRNAVAEHALGMLLNLMNNLNKADREIREGKWLREDNRGNEIHGKTIGIIGFGNTGQSFAKKFIGFETPVIAYDKYAEVNASHVTAVSMEQLFEQADIVSFHIPLTTETNDLVNDEFLSSFKKNSYLINTSRGKILNTKALVKHLKTGKILGAALDVIEYENQSFESQASIADQETYGYLLASPRVLLTPHIAGWTHESYRLIAEVLLEKITNLTSLPSTHNS